MTQGSRPADIDRLIAIIQSEFPTADIRITGRTRTVRHQAEIFAKKIRSNRLEFIGSYRRTKHIVEMDTWYQSNRNATLQQTISEFEAILNRALSRRAIVSNHLSNTARDISWPIGNQQQLNLIESRIQGLGATVIREPVPANEKHWHVDL